MNFKEKKTKLEKEFKATQEQIVALNKKLSELSGAYKLVEELEKETESNKTKKKKDENNK